MTRKQYKKKMRHAYRNIAKAAKAEGKKIAAADRIPIPRWGVEITCGPHAGEKLVSYDQMWETMYEILEGTPFLEGIECVGN